jgi:RNA polymerase sigma factor (TIGR02999 family)
MSEVTRILTAIEQGDPHAASQLLPLVYHELRQLAAARLAREAPGQLLEATALVHDAYVRLVDVDRVQHWNHRGHFFAAAAEAMRRILIEHARHDRRAKHGGRLRQVSLHALDAQATSAADALDLLAVDEALAQLALEDAPKAELVKLRFFGGLTVEEAAACMGISRATADRHWAYARAWLFDRLRFISENP